MKKKGVISAATAEVPIAKVIDPPRVNWEAEGFDYWEDVRYSDIHERCLMDIWAPKGAEKLPCIIWIHGGGWSAEDLTKRYRPEMEMAAIGKQGFVCVSIEYRLAQHEPFPAQIQDVKCAVRFLRANADKYGIDPDHIGAWGESAGGHLTALLAATPDLPEFEGEGGWNEYSSAIQAAVPWYAPCDMVKSAVDKEENDLYELLFDGPVDEKKNLIWASSPTKYVGDNLPPMLLMHGDVDRLVPTWQSIDFYQALRAHGNVAELIVVPGQGHGFFDGQQYYDAIADFFTRWLKK